MPQHRLDVERPFCEFDFVSMRKRVRQASRFPLFSSKSKMFVSSVQALP